MAKAFLQSCHKVTEIQGVLCWRKSYRNPKIIGIAAITCAVWNTAAKSVLTLLRADDAGLQDTPWSLRDGFPGHKDVLWWPSLRAV